MELLSAERSVLVVIDLQGRLVEMVERPARTRAAAIRLLNLAGLFEVPVILTEQYPGGLGLTHPDVRAAFDAVTARGVPTRFVEKTSFGCCGDGGFIEALEALRPIGTGEPRQIVIAGIEAHVCVMQTVTALLSDAERVHVVHDAVSARGEETRRRALDRMACAGAVITHHESVGFEWARDKKHPSFRAMSALFREPLP